MTTCRKAALPSFRRCRADSASIFFFCASMALRFSSSCMCSCTSSEARRLAWSLPCRVGLCSRRCFHVVSGAGPLSEASGVVFCELLVLDRVSQLLSLWSFLSAKLVIFTLPLAAETLLTWETVLRHGLERPLASSLSSCSFTFRSSCSLADSSSPPPDLAAAAGWSSPAKSCSASSRSATSESESCRRAAQGSGPRAPGLRVQLPRNLPSASSSALAT